MPATFVSNGNQSLLPSANKSAEKSLQKEKELKKYSGQCGMCGGQMIDDEELGKSCENCGRLPLTFSCC